MSADAVEQDVDVPARSRDGQLESLSGKVSGVSELLAFIRAKSEPQRFFDEMTRKGWTPERWAESVVQVMDSLMKKMEMYEEAEIDDVKIYHETVSQLNRMMRLYADMVGKLGEDDALAHKGGKWKGLPATDRRKALEAMMPKILRGKA